MLCRFLRHLNNCVLLLQDAKTADKADDEQLHIEIEEPDEKIYWADICQTPDVNSTEIELEFPKLKELEDLSDNDDERPEEGKTADENAPIDADETEAAEPGDARDGSDRSDDVISEPAGLDATEDPVAEELNAKASVAEELDGEEHACDGYYEVDSMDFERRDEVTTDVESTQDGGNVVEASSEEDSGKYVPAFEEVGHSNHISVLRASELILEQRLEAMSKLDKPRAGGHSSTREELPIVNSLTLDLENSGQKTEVEVQNQESGEGKPEEIEEHREGNGRVYKMSENEASVTFDSVQHNDQKSEVTRSKAITEQPSVENEVKETESTKGGEQRGEAEQKKAQFCKRLLDALSNPALADEKTKYFCYLGSYRYLSKLFTSRQALFPRNPAFKEALLNSEKHPVVLIIVTSKQYLESDPVREGRICAVGLARFNNQIGKRDVRDFREHFDVDIVCRAKSRKTMRWNYAQEDEIPRNEAHKVLRSYDTMIRQGMVEEFVDVLAWEQQVCVCLVVFSLVTHSLQFQLWSSIIHRSLFWSLIWSLMQKGQVGLQLLLFVLL